LLVRLPARLRDAAQDDEPYSCSEEHLTAEGKIFFAMGSPNPQKWIYIRYPSHGN